MIIVKLTDRQKVSDLAHQFGARFESLHEPDAHGRIPDGLAAYFRTDARLALDDLRALPYVVSAEDVPDEEEA